ncbi:MAG: elongation factor P [Alphaproteobacteria bacterium]|nr:elongation factor P [Alphaproteobacteria bacterium]
MKVLPSNLRIGNVVKENNKLWSVVRMQHTQPGKGGAYFQVELRGVLDQTKQIKRIRSSEEMERAILDERQATFVYRDGEGYVFMDQESFEQTTVPEVYLGDAKIFVKEGMIVTLTLYEGEIVSVVLPSSIQVIVKEADAVVKGQTAASSYKNSVLENGVNIKVPPHIEAGAAILVNPNTCEYLEKAK